MESPLSPFRMHWDHEPTPPGWALRRARRSRNQTAEKHRTPNNQHRTSNMAQCNVPFDVRCLDVRCWTFDDEVSARRPLSRPLNHSPMKFVICNEIFQGWKLEETFAH